MAILQSDIAKFVDGETEVATNCGASITYMSGGSMAIDLSLEVGV